MNRRRRNQPGGSGTQPISNRYTQTRRRKPTVQQKSTRKGDVHSNARPNQLGSVISWIKNADINNLSSQLHTIADHMGTFGQMADIMKQLNGSVSKGSSGFSLFNLLKDNNSITNLIQAVLPALGGIGPVEEENSDPIKAGPKKVNPISVETHKRKV